MNEFDLAETGHDGDPGVRHLAARGELDLDTSHRFTERLDQLIEGGSTLVVLDCSELEFIDGCGLRAVLIATDQLESAEVDSSWTTRAPCCAA